jgi:hypothetical protein
LKKRFKAVKAKLEENGLSYIGIPGDGNCGVAAVAASIDVPATELRDIIRETLLSVQDEDAMNSIALHARAELSQVHVTDVPHDDRGVLEAYATHMGTHGRYITELELRILSAVAERPIYVLSAYARGPKDIVLARPPSICSGPLTPDGVFAPLRGLSPEPIILLHYNGHFDLLVPVPLAESEGVRGGSAAHEGSDDEGEGGEGSREDPPRL